MNPSDYATEHDIAPGEIIAVEDDDQLLMMEVGAVEDGAWVEMAVGTPFLFDDLENAV